MLARKLALAWCLAAALATATPRPATAQPAATAHPTTTTTVQPAATAQPTTAAKPTAEDIARAEVLFQEARTHVAAHDYAEACRKFAASHMADPSYGAVLNLGECHLLLQRPASAWNAFRDAAELARRQGRPDRVAEATARMQAVEPTLHRLTIVVKDPPPGVQVQRDGTIVPARDIGTPLPVDPGNHTISAAAPGRKPFSTTVTLAGDGKSTTVNVTLEYDQSVTANPDPTARSSFPPERIVTLALLGVAIGAGATGGLLGSEAGSKWDRARPGCNERNQCTPESFALASEARDHAHGATAAWIVAGASMTGAVVIFFTAPSVTRIRRGRVALPFGASASPEGAALSIQGTF